MCLNSQSPDHRRMTHKNYVCPGWADGIAGAVDHPAGNPYQMEDERD